MNIEIVYIIDDRPHLHIYHQLVDKLNFDKPMNECM